MFYAQSTGMVISGRHDLKFPSKSIPKKEKKEAGTECGASSEMTAESAGMQGKDSTPALQKVWVPPYP